MKHTTQKLILSLTATILAAGAARAVELPMLGTNLPPVDLHGFASQGYIYNTGNNNYLGGDSSRGTFDFRNYGINASTAFGKWRLGAQVFGQKLGPYGNDTIKLDWADADYQAAQWFGVRAGQVKMPRGLYNESIDLDSTRAFILLPQSVYDARLRDFQASFDGGMIYGNIDLKQAGSLDYKFFGGHIPMSTDSGAADYFNNNGTFPNLAISMDDAFGGSLFWNTPVQGLRAGYSFSDYQNFYTLRNVTHVGIMYKNAPDYYRNLMSVEYTRGDWVFATEGGFEQNTYDVGTTGKAATTFLYPSIYYAYASATWRANHWLQLGTYYSRYHWQQRSVNSIVANPNADQGDAALSARFDLTDYLIFKVEAHYMDGAGALFSVPQAPQPIANRDKSWAMFDAQITVSF